ncbi:MAG TPA: hypothetical protein VD969_05180 [Symbiobacteriaceae bacterium]|nr:hypothetical protein [Symbiobacteriaceae bacterium]
MRLIMRYVGLLAAMEVVFSGIAFLLSDWPWLAALAAPVFVVLVWLTGVALAADRGCSRRATALTAAFIATIWQLPGLQGSIRFLSDTAGWTEYDGVTDLQDFLMQTWHTVFLPVLAHIGGRAGGYYAAYYVGLVLASPLLILLFVCAALWKMRRPGRA